MTRANIHIKLSDGSNINCVCDSTSAPEQGYFVENLLLPLLTFNDADMEILLLNQSCAMHELRTNATYRYIINLQTKAVHFFEETYDYQKGKFSIGDNLTDRYLDYIENTDGLKEQFRQIKSQQI
jgi:hypothetical protein